jgi:putative peptide zinc metalloprotease protein
MCMQIEDGAGPLPPRLADGVDVRSERCSGGRTLYTVVDHGKRVAIEFDDGDLSPSGALDQGLLMALRDEGFLGEAAPSGEQPALVRGPIRRFLDTLDVSSTRGEELARWVYCNGAHHAFQPIVVVLQAIIAVAGVVATVVGLRSGPGVELRLDASLLPAFIALGVAAVLVHELAHAVVVVHYGRAVDRVGFRLHLGAPAFYVESVGALLLTRRQRMIQAAAGPWAEWVFTSLVAIAALPLRNHTLLAPLLARFVALNAFNVVTNLLPFVGLDGSHILADGIGVPDLNRRARGAVGRLVLDLVQRRRPSAGALGLAGYASANFVVAAVLLVLSGFLWFETFADLIRTLLDAGPSGWAVLALAAVLLGRPALLAIRPQAELGIANLFELIDELRFRRTIPWRVAAIERLRRTEQAIAALSLEQLNLLAGQLHICHPTEPLDPERFAWADVAVGSRRPRRLAVARSELADLVRSTLAGSPWAAP